MSSLKHRSLSTMVTFSLVFGLLVGCQKKSSEEPIVKLAIWGNYLSPDLQKGFTEQTGIKLELTHYSSNEELLAKIQAGGADIDMGVPSDYMVQIMAQLGLLESLDKAQLPNFQNLDPKVLNLEYDPGNTYSIPYGWTTTGIVVHKGLYKSDITSLKDLFEKPELKGQISALDDMRELAAISLKLHNHSANSTSAEQVQEAFRYLKKVKPQIKVFTSNAVDLLKNKEIKAGLVYSSDALLAQKQNPQIQFSIPQEGATRAIDSLVIFKHSRRKPQAHAFLNFLMTEDANIKTVQSVRVGPVVKGVREKLPIGLRDNKALFPDSALYKKLEGIKDLGEANALYEEQWTQLKLM